MLQIHGFLHILCEIPPLNRDFQRLPRSSELMVKMRKLKNTKYLKSEFFDFLRKLKNSKRQKSAFSSHFVFLSLPCFNNTRFQRDLVGLCATLRTGTPLLDFRCLAGLDNNDRAPYLYLINDL